MATEDSVLLNMLATQAQSSKLFLEQRAAKATPEPSNRHQANLQPSGHLQQNGGERGRKGGRGDKDKGKGKAEGKGKDKSGCRGGKGKGKGKAEGKDKANRWSNATRRSTRGSAATMMCFVPSANLPVAARLLAASMLARSIATSCAHDRRGPPTARSICHQARTRSTGRWNLPGSVTTST